MKKWMITLGMILTVMIVAAQDHPMSVAIRGGYTSSVSMQFFTDDLQAIEGMFSWRDQGLQLTVLKEKYLPVFVHKNDHFFFSYGYGGHLGYEWRRDFHPSDILPSHFFRSGPSIGVNGLAGLEYCFYRVPVSIGLQYIPYAEFSTTRFFRLNLGISESMHAIGLIQNK